MLQLNKPSPKHASSLEDELRHVRLETNRARNTKSQLLTDDGQNWAVSYSDMLMVLMSFFVLFFSFDDQKRESLVSRIALEMQSRTPGTHSDAKGTSQNGPMASRSTSTADLSPGVATEPRNGQGQMDTMGPPKNTTFRFQDVSDIEQQLQTLATVSTVSPTPITTGAKPDDHLILHFSDQIYDKREFTVNNRLAAELKQVLETLAPYKDRIQIIFIGHTDSLNIHPKNLYVSSNFDLSSLRASRALAFAIDAGFDPTSLAVEAAGPNTRDSRSLSIKIIPRP